MAVAASRRARRTNRPGLSLEICPLPLPFVALCRDRLARRSGCRAGVAGVPARRGVARSTPLPRTRHRCDLARPWSRAVVPFTWPELADDDADLGLPDVDTAIATALAYGSLAARLARRAGSTRSRTLADPLPCAHKATPSTLVVELAAAVDRPAVAGRRLTPRAWRSLIRSGRELPRRLYRVGSRGPVADRS